MLNTLNGLFIAAVLAGTPLLLGALGEILTEKSGNLNLGVEGMMFMGAITGLAGSYYYEQAVIGSGGNPNGAVSSVIALLTSSVRYTLRKNFRNRFRKLLMSDLLHFDLPGA